MAKPINNLSAEYVKSLLDYDPKTGLLRWKVNRPPRGFAGSAAGYTTTWGYISINISGQAYYAHRLAWLIMTGKWPQEEIDHKSTNKADNRWNNLRPASRRQNGYNRAKDKRNTSGYKGVRITKSGKYQAVIQAGKKHYSLGTYKTPEAAAKVYKAAAKKLHKEFAYCE